MDRLTTNDANSPHHYSPPNVKAPAMNESRPRHPFPTTSPNKRSTLNLHRVIEDSIIEKPGPIPASRRPALSEVKNRALPTAAAAPQAERKPRRKQRVEFAIFKDDELATTGPSPSLRIPQLPSALTSLLLSHSSPRPKLPELPTPPRSRRPRNIPLAAAQSLLPPPSSTTTSASSPHHLLRQLRKTLETTATTNKRRQSPTPRTTPQKGHVISLLDLPALTHHSEHAIITLCPPTHVQLTLRGSSTKYTITASTLTAVSPAEPPRAYEIEDIPWKHLPAYRYARRFVAAVRRKTVLAYGGIHGVCGRVWADGRGVVTFSSGEEVEIKASGEVVVVSASEGGENGGLVEKAKEVYQWLLKHPHPAVDVKAQEESRKEKEKEKIGEWELTGETKFVKGVGWCREIGEGQWSMKFLDGVRLEIRGQGVTWVEKDGDRRQVQEGVRDREVRERVAEFVKAGL